MRAAKKSREKTIEGYLQQVASSSVAVVSNCEINYKNKIFNNILYKHVIKAMS